MENRLINITQDRLQKPVITGVNQIVWNMLLMRSDTTKTCRQWERFRYDDTHVLLPETNRIDSNFL